VRRAGQLLIFHRGALVADHSGLQLVVPQHPPRARTRRQRTHRPEDPVDAAGAAGGHAGVPRGRGPRFGPVRGPRGEYPDSGPIDDRPGGSPLCDRAASLYDPRLLLHLPRWRHDRGSARAPSGTSAAVCACSKGASGSKRPCSWRPAASLLRRLPRSTVIARHLLRPHFSDAGICRLAVYTATVGVC
jgi:hypothetical protein